MQWGLSSPEKQTGSNFFSPDINLIRQEGTVSSGGCTGMEAPAWSGVCYVLISPRIGEQPSLTLQSPPASSSSAPGVPIVTPSGAMPVGFFMCKHLQVQLFGEVSLLNAAGLDLLLLCLEADAPHYKGEFLHSCTLKVFLVPKNFPFQWEFAFGSHFVMPHV